MNRVIKFRAYSPKEGMIYLQPSGLQYFDFEGNYSLGFTVDGYSEFWAHEQYEWPTKSAKDFPIMQFTGLHDKNGKEIYEGDVLKSVPTMKLDDTIIISVVEWSATRAMWVANAIKYAEEEYLFEAAKPHHETEIIGNIYEHPNLNHDPQIQIRPGA